MPDESAVKIEPSRVRNDLFDNRIGFDLGRPRLTFIAWYLVECFFFLSPLPWPSWLKSSLLRLFGAKIGKAVYWKPRINIHIPWNLEVGDHTWMGEEVCIINFAPVTIGAHCCLSQRSFLCAANHDYRSPDMRYRHSPIKFGNGVWIGACAFVGPGVEIGHDAVLTAMSLANRSLEAGYIYAGNPCSRLRSRWAKQSSSGPAQRTA